MSKASHNILFSLLLAGIANATHAEELANSMAPDSVYEDLNASVAASQTDILATPEVLRENTPSSEVAAQKIYESSNADLDEAKTFVSELKIGQADILPPTMVEPSKAESSYETLASRAASISEGNPVENQQHTSVLAPVVEKDPAKSMPTSIEPSADKQAAEKPVGSIAITAPVSSAMPADTIKANAERQDKKRKAKKKIKAKLKKLADQDRKMGSMLRQFFDMLGFVPKDEDFLEMVSAKKSVNHIRSGWYVGGVVGATINQTRLMVTEGVTGVTSFTFKKRFENTLPTFGIQIGKQFVHGKLLTDFSASFMGSFTNNKVTINNETEATKYENSLKEKYRAGVALALGTPVAENITAFGKLGVTYSKFNFHYRSTSNAGNFGKQVVGIAPGVLFKYQPTPKFSMSLDVSYMKALGQMKSGNIASLAGFNYNANVRPQAVTVLLGFNRVF